jgi:hypothetical protein
MYQQLWGYKVEEKLYLGVREQKRLNTTVLDKQKAKQSRYTPWWRLGGEEYGSYSFLTSALDGGVVSVTLRPRFTPGERTRGTHCTGGWTQRLEEKSFAPCRGSNRDRSVVQSVVRHYTA